MIAEQCSRSSVKTVASRLHCVMLCSLTLRSHTNADNISWRY